MASIENYVTNRHSFKTGDVIVYTKSDCLGVAISVLTSSDISHVGMCLWMNDRLFSIESMLMNVKPDMKGGYRRGISMSLFSQRVHGATNPIFVYRTQNMVPENQEAMVRWLMQAETSKVPYDIRGAIENTKSGWLAEILQPFLRSVTVGTHALFCSELVTKALQRGGILDLDFDPVIQTPSDVISFNCYTERVQLC